MPRTTPPYHVLVQSLLPAVCDAAKLLEEYRQSGVQVESKRDGSPVSVADRQAECMLLAALADAAPEIPAIGEEAVAAGTAPDPRALTFYVDALDGTRGYVGGGGEYTINIGLVNDGVPVFGIVGAPALDRLFITVARNRLVETRLSGAGASRILGGDPAEPVHVRSRNGLPVRVLSSKSSDPDRLASLLKKFDVAETAYVNSSLKFCMIAAGEADIYPRFGPTCFWDTVAGHAVLLAAGGQVCTADARPMTYAMETGPQTAEAGYINPHFIAVGDPELLSRIG